MLVSAITVPEKDAFLVQIGFVAAIALVMLTLIVLQLRRMAGQAAEFNEEFARLRDWSQEAFADLCWIGNYSRSASPFGTRLRFVLNSRRELNKEAERDDGEPPGQHPGWASVELVTRRLLLPLATFRRRLELRTSEHAVTLDIRFKFPGLVLHRARAQIDGRPLGVFEAGACEVTLRDESGPAVGVWETGQRLLGVFSSGELRRGPLKVQGAVVAEVLVAAISSWAQSLSRQSSPWCTDVRESLTDHQRKWLLATVALAAYAVGVSRGFQTKH